MSAIRIGVIGLGWFGEIHCETIVGVPSLELAALCTRRPDRLKQQADQVLERWAALLKTDLPAFQQQMQQANVRTLIVNQPLGQPAAGGGGK